MSFITTHLEGLNSERGLRDLVAGNWSNKIILIEGYINPSVLIKTFSEDISRKLDSAKMANCLSAAALSGSLAILKSSGVQVLLATKIEGEVQIEAAKFGILIAEKGNFFPTRGQQFELADFQDLISWDPSARAIYQITTNFFKQNKSQETVNVN